MSGLRLSRQARLGPLPWIVGAMAFLAALGIGAGLAIDEAGRMLRAGAADRITIQIVTADPRERERQAIAALREVRRFAGVAAARRVPQGELEALLAPWLGTGLAQNGIAIPAMIDVDLTPGAHPRPEALAEAIRLSAPAARVDDHGRWLAPLDRLLRDLRMLAIALVTLVAATSAAVVALAARAAFEAQRETVELLHMIGATDRQIARLFERRIGLRALAGAGGGTLMAVAALGWLARQLAGLGSDLIGAASLPHLGWWALLLVPIAGTGLAMATTRTIIIRTLGRAL